MRNLLLRDWKLYKDALLLVGTVILVIAPLSFLGIPAKELRVIMPMFGRIAFGLGCLLPFLVHARELQQGTLGDVLALPIARRDLVKLRWAEGLFFGTLFFLLVTLPSLHALPCKDLLAAHTSGTLPWIFFWTFAAQLPFQLRFGQKGGIALGVTVFLVEGWGMASMPADQMKGDPVIFQKLVHALQCYQHAWTALGSAAPYAEALLLALLIGGSFHFAVWAAERCDA